MSKGDTAPAMVDIVVERVALFQAVCHRGIFYLCLSRGKVFVPIGNIEGGAIAPLTLPK